MRTVIGIGLLSIVQYIKGLIFGRNWGLITDLRSRTVSYGRY